MSTHTSAVPARNGSATAVCLRHMTDAGRLRRQSTHMLLLSVAVAASLVACGSGAAKPVDPRPVRAAVASTSPSPYPTPTVSQSTHQTLTGPRAYS